MATEDLVKATTQPLSTEGRMDGWMDGLMYRRVRVSLCVCGGVAEFTDAA